MIVVTTAPHTSSSQGGVASVQWSDPVVYDLTRTEKRASVPEEKKAVVPKAAGVYAICAGGSGKDASDLILDIGECGPRPSSRRGLRERLASTVAHSASERIAEDIKRGKLRDDLFVVWAETPSKIEAKEAQDALICLFRREYGKQPNYNRKLEHSNCPDSYSALYESLKSLVGNGTRLPLPVGLSMTETQLPQHVESVVEKLRALPAQRLGEVEDFIDFLSHRDSERELTRMAMTASEPVLSAVWDNADDAEYDAL